MKPIRQALVRIVALIGLLPFAAAPALAADLVIGKVGPGGVKLGDQIQYTITVTNLDAGAVRDGVVQDATPAGLVFVSNAGDCTTAFPCALPLLNALATATITSTFAVPSTYAGTDPILNTATVTSSADNNPANNTATAATAIARVEGFYTLPPCRVLDTRDADGPALLSGVARTFNLRDLCGLPANASAVSFNVTVTSPNVAGNLRLYAGGTAAPLASSINFAPGQTRANNGIVPVSGDGKLTVQNDQPPPSTPGSYNFVHAILDVNGYFAKSDTVPTLPGEKVRVRPAPEVEITFDSVTVAGVTSAKVIEFPDNRTGDVDQDLKAFFPPGSPLQALVPSVLVPKHVKALGKGGPAGPPTFVLALVDTSAGFARTAEFHGLEEFLLGWHPPCLVAADRTQEPRTFYAREALKGEPSLEEETGAGGPVFVDISSGCGSNKGSGWNFSLYLTGRDARPPVEVVRFKLQMMQGALSSLGRFITNGPVAASLANEVAAALASLDTAPASSLANMTNFIGIVDANPAAFDNSSRNVAGELVGRAQSASYILKKLGGAIAFDVRIGDNDGYGFGAASVPDNAAFLFDIGSSTVPYTFQDKRSIGEKAATDGSEHTDAYGAFDWFTVPSAPLTTSFDVKFPVEGTLQSATLEVDMGGFQSSTWGPINVAYNGIVQPNLFFFDDTAAGTRVRQFPLNAAAIANANAEGGFRLTIGIGTSNDGVAFDYFRLTGVVQP